jgi:hypothetical protein
MLALDVHMHGIFQQSVVEYLKQNVRLNSSLFFLTQLEIAKK